MNSFNLTEAFGEVSERFVAEALETDTVISEDVKMTVPSGEEHMMMNDVNNTKNRRILWLRGGIAAAIAGVLIAGNIALFYGLGRIGKNGSSQTPTISDTTRLTELTTETTVSETTSLYSDTDSLYYLNYEFNNSQSCYYVVGCNPKAVKIEIPDSVNDSEGNPRRVGGINSRAFADCTKLEEIVIPDTVDYIGIDAFSDTPWYQKLRSENELVIVNGILLSGDRCTGSVKLPDSVRVISDGAFAGTEGLTSVTISSPDCTVGNDAFADCHNLSDVNIPEELSFISRNPFRNTPWAKEQQKNSDLFIVNGCLLDGTKCKGEVTIPDNVHSISSCTFEGNTNIKSVNINNKIEFRICDDAFKGCTNLKTCTFRRCHIVEIGDHVFDGCGQLTIRDYNDSYLHEYADKKGIPFEDTGVTHGLHYHFDENGVLQPREAEYDDLISDGTHHFKQIENSVYRTEDNLPIITVRHPEQYLEENDKNKRIHIILLSIEAVGNDWYFIGFEMADYEGYWIRNLYFWANSKTGKTEYVDLRVKKSEYHIEVPKPTSDDEENNINGKSEYYELGLCGVSAAADGKSIYAAYSPYIIQIPIPGNGNIKLYDTGLGQITLRYDDGGYEDHCFAFYNLDVLDNGNILFYVKYIRNDEPYPGGHNECGIYELNPSDGTVKQLQKNICVNMFRVEDKWICYKYGKTIGEEELAEYLPESNRFRTIAKLDNPMMTVEDISKDAVLLVDWYDSSEIMETEPEILVSLMDGKKTVLPPWEE